MNMTLRKPAPAARPEKAAQAARIRELAFGHTVAALAAKLAVIDKPVNAAERDAFARIFDKDITLFEEALGDYAPHLHYAARLKAFFHQDRLRLERVLDDLFAFALCDGHAEPTEMEWLYEVGIEMSLNPRQMLAKMSHAIIGDVSAPHIILNIKPRAKEEVVRHAYRQALAQAHPDRTGASSSLVAELFARRYTHVQEAYAALKPKKK